MKKWMLLLVVGAAFSANSAVLVPEQGVSVLYINGVETEKSIGKQQIELGETEVIIRLDKDFGRGNSSQIYTSVPYVVKFTVSGDEVKLNHPKARSYQEAENAFRNKQPQWAIEQDGNVVSYDQEVLPPNDGTLFPYAGMDKLVAAYYSGQAGKEIKQQAVVADKSATQGKESSNLTQLKAWYLKSSEEERKAFRRWMIDQE